VTYPREEVTLSVDAIIAIIAAVVNAVLQGGSNTW
jgi:hypothetical protein